VQQHCRASEHARGENNADCIPTPPLQTSVDAELMLLASARVGHMLDLVLLSQCSVVFAPEPHQRQAVPTACRSQLLAQAAPG
jgi:hypothetical protein